jgi:hypothetical protein
VRFGELPGRPNTPNHPLQPTAGHDSFSWTTAHRPAAAEQGCSPEDSVAKRLFLQDVSTECRAVLRERRYSTDKAAKLIEWLRHEDAAVADMAGRALAAMGTPAFNDLLQRVMGPGAAPWPNAVWTLELFADCHERLLPVLRLWLRQGTGEMERQCAVSLAHILVTRRQQGHPTEPDDVAACQSILERDADSSPALRVHLRGLQEGLERIS